MNLKQIADINAGYPFRGKIPEASDSDVLAVQMKNVSLTDGILWPECVQTRLTGKRKPDYLNTGDVLIAARGSHNYATPVSQVPTTAGKQAVAAPHFFVIRLKQADILPEFMAWLLNQAPVQRYFQQNAEGTLTKSIRRSVLENTPVVIPPLEKQRAIIALANALQKQQRLVQQLTSNNKRIMSSIARDLFTNKKVNP